MMFLDRGYDLDALSRSAAACVATLAGADYEAEPQTSGRPGREVVEEAGQRLQRD
jgi:acetoin utilization deacetylase AcuC-like enzyme